MAVYAAHLTRTLQGTPTIFQVTAQEALGATVKPALRKVVEVIKDHKIVEEKSPLFTQVIFFRGELRTPMLSTLFTQFLAATYPNKCGWCLHWYDEVYLLFDCCLQYYYLKHYAASFSESFYDLIRVPISTSNEFNNGQQLPVYLERASLALLVLVPYLKDRIERIVERWREDDEDGRLGKSRSDRVRRAAIHVYCTVHTVWWCARLAWLARYCAGRAAAPGPQLAALGLTLRPAPPRAQPDHTWAELLRSLATGQCGSAVVTFPMLGAAALRAVEYGAFGVQFLRWWDARAAPAQTLPAPPPPKRDERALRWKNKCPLCLQSWKIPTVLPVSGYIFCYICISRHMRTHSACPVTRCPAAEHSLVRLYID